MLNILIHENNPSIICLQETHFRDNNIHHLKNFDGFHQNRGNQLRASGGVTIYIRKNIDAQKILLNTTLEAVAVSISAPKKINICNVYIAPNQEFTSQDIIRLINQIPSPRIIVGDFNGHHIIWGSKNTNSRGHTIANAVEQFNLNIMNNGENTRFNSYTGDYSVLDLSICDSTMTPSLTWEVLPFLYGSDHFPIKITNMEEIVYNTKPVEKWKLKTANWNLYQNRVEEDLQNFQIDNDIDGTLEKFTNIIINAATASIGKTTHITKHIPVPWWNNECQNAIKQSKHAFNKYKRHPTLENLLTFKNLRAKARYTVKHSKKESWKQYISTINTSSSTSEVWNKIKRIGGTKTYTAINSLTYEGRIISTNEDIANALAKTYEKYSSNSNYDKTFCHLKQQEENKTPIIINEDNNSPLNQPLTRTEFEDALSNLKNASPGPDDIPAIFIRNLPDTAKTLLLEIYNTIWLQHKFPKSWTEATIIPILKPNSIKINPESYRPISLTCAMCKLMEKIVNKRLVWYLENKSLLPNEQSGFRKHRSTTDNIIDLESEINEGFINKQKCLAVFFDIKKAYDTAWKYNILKQLTIWEIQGNILAFINNFLNNRYFRVRANGCLSNRTPQMNGIPQGSIISVTLFLAAINEITKNIIAPVKARLYADDLVLYMKGKNIQSMKNMLQKHLRDIEIWSNTTGFKFSTEKTKCVLFSKKPVINYPNLYLYNQALEFVQEIRFLGMIFDQCMNWQTHIKRLILSCQNGLNLLKFLANKKWGADSDILLRLYRLLIRSKIDYGSIAYSSATKTTLKYIDTVHNSAIRIILGAYCTSPIASLQCEVSEPPLHYRRTYLSLAYATTISANPRHPTYKNTFSTRYTDVYQRKKRAKPPFYERINKYSRQLQITFPQIFPSYLQTLPPWTIKPPDCNTNLTHFKKNDTNPSLIVSHFKEILNKYPKHIQIYTDASRTEDGTGAAIVSPNSIRKYKLSKYTSIYTAELYAILQALIYIRQDYNHHFLIITDSLSALKGMDQLYTTHPILQLIKNELQQIENDGKEIKFIWVPSHIGITGNEKADQAARDAIIDHNANIVLRTISTDFKSYLRGEINKEWQRNWEQSSSKLAEIKQTVKPWSHKLKKRREQIIVTRLRIGHTKFSHGYLLNRSEPPICETCQTRLTVKHVLVECSKFRNLRRSYNIPGTLAEVLNDNANFTNLMSYLKDTKLIVHI